MGLGKVAEGIVTRSETGLVPLVEKLMATELRGPYAKNLLEKLRLGRGIALLGEKLLALAERFLAKGGEFFRLAKVIEYRFTGFSHLFTDGLEVARANPARAAYFRSVDELAALVQEQAGSQRFATRAFATWRKLFKSK